jgi:ATP adenylyltransferase
MTRPLEPEAPSGANLERLWTPWRAAYVLQPSTTGETGCFLCRLADLEPGGDAANLVLLHEPDVFLLLNRFPYNSGHLLAAPRRHIGDFTALSGATRDALFGLCQRAIAALRDEYRPQGFNVGLNLGAVAGAGVPDHLHAHLVPRWGGDANFMTVVGETKVMPESLEQTYARLRPYFA